MTRRDRRRSFLIRAAKVAGVVAIVTTIVIVKPFARSEPSSTANLEPYASGFDSPTFVAAAPGEPRRLYVVEQPGRIRYVADGRIAGTLLDIRSRVSSGGERGLLSVAFSPRYARDHLFYVDYTDRNGDTRVVEFRSRDDKAVLSSARQLLFVRQPYANHNGGQLQFGPDRLLYVGMGDGGSAGDPQNHAQNVRDHLGKLLRIDPSRPAARWETIGYGLRNPWRFSFDRATGDLYIADVGQDAWEEIDFRPHAAPALAGRYVFGDWFSGRIWSLRIEDGRAVDLRKESARIGELSSFGEDSAGELYAVSTATGRLYRVTG